MMYRGAGENQPYNVVPAHPAGPGPIDPSVDIQSNPIVGLRSSVIGLGPYLNSPFYRNHSNGYAPPSTNGVNPTLPYLYSASNPYLNNDYAWNNRAMPSSSVTYRPR